MATPGSNAALMRVLGAFRRWALIGRSPHAPPTFKMGIPPLGKTEKRLHIVCIAIATDKM
jgi:hypothetical protein